MPAKSFPATPLFLAYILGTYAGYFVTDHTAAYPLFLCCCLPFLFPIYRWSFVQRSLCCAVFFLLGGANSYFDQQWPGNHYHFEWNKDTSNVFRIALIEPLRAGRSSQRFYGKVLTVNKKKAQGKILVQFDNDRLHPTFRLGDIIEGKGALTAIRPPLNPGAFDYRAYLFSQKIAFQWKADPSTVIKIGRTKNPFVRCRSYLQNRLFESKFLLTTKQLLNTLLLGDRSQVERPTLEQYAAAGVMHLFAISGLHVGLLLLLLRWLFDPLRRIPYGQGIAQWLPLVFLWGFAFLVGATASVIRAVTLFSAFEFSRLIQRQLPVSYLVLLSMFLLVFFYPRYVLQLGFQLSYLAVFGIVFITPLFPLSSLPKLVRKGTEVLVVTLAAQVGVALLSSYHFHQFPGLFLLGNMVLLPLMGLILYMALGALTLLIFTAPPTFLVHMVDALFAAMNSWVFWLAKQKNFLFDDLYFSPWGLFWGYVLLLGIIALRKLGMAKSKWMIGGACAALLAFIWVFPSWEKPSLWVSHHYGQTTLVALHSTAVHFYSDKNELSSSLVAAYKHHAGKRKHRVEKLNQAYWWGTQPLVVIDDRWVNTAPHSCQRHCCTIA